MYAEGEEQAFDYVIDLVDDGTAKERWERRRERLLSDNIDVTEFPVEVLTSV